MILVFKVGLNERERAKAEAKEKQLRQRDAKAHRGALKKKMIGAFSSIRKRNIAGRKIEGGKKSRAFHSNLNWQEARQKREQRPGQYQKKREKHACDKETQKRTPLKD
jgi:hypothetical protein